MLSTIHLKGRFIIRFVIGFPTLHPIVLIPCVSLPFGLGVRRCLSQHFVSWSKGSASKMARQTSPRQGIWRDHVVPTEHCENLKILFPQKKNREFIIVQRFNRPNRTGPSPKRTLVYGIAPMCIPRTLLRSSFRQVNQLQLVPFLGVFARIDYHASVQRAIFVAICAS